MKKKLCISLLLLISVTTFGQVIPEGTRFLGGDLNFNSTESKVKDVVMNSNFGIGIRPSFTKFTKDNSSFTVAIGYNIVTAGVRSTFSSDLIKTTLHTISAGFYLSNYKMFNEKFGVSIRYGGDVGYSFNTSSTNRDTRSFIKSTILNLSAGPGIIYLLNEKWAVEGVTSLVNISSVYTKSGDVSAFSMGTDISLNPSVGIGFRYFLK
ncbi:hypothetical protein [Emticicia agri]|uniref:Outer membrane protein beta-barrel domain-containing protein n=1 Tax=Emticicia agri TaxID=2492393 RepID=A0A4V1ZDI7_9BACT|nr:hypothetical protein [Emticicia agri]RYU96300.1 hypothetical protein EWM59_07240 [Emticicia agri]